MVLGRSALGLAMAAILATMAVPILFQEPTPGNPDDVAELLPQETLLFVELVKGPKLLADWKEYVGAFCTPAGKANVTKQIEETVRKALDVVPEKLLKDLEKGLPSLQRVALALTSKSISEDFSFILIATSSDPELFKRIVEEDLKVFAGEEKTHQGFKVLSIRKLGDIKFPEPVLLAAAGRRLVVSTKWESLAAALDRAAGKGQGPDLRQNPIYKAFAPPAGADPVLRAFARFPWTEMFDSSVRGPWNYRRSGAHGMDVADAILGFQKIRGVIVEAQMKPGQIATQTRLRIDAGCKLYDVFRQPAGPKDALNYMPADAALAVHLNLKGGKAVWDEIAALIKRGGEIEARSRRRGDEPPRDFSEEFAREMEREVGFKPADVAAVIGDEICYGMVGDDFFANPQALIGSLLFVIKTTDPAKAKEMLAKIAGKIAPYQAKAEEGAEFWLPPQEGEMPVFALHKSMVLIATRVEVIKNAIKASADGRGLAKSLPADVARTSKLFALRYGVLYKAGMMLAAQMAGPGGPPPIPDVSKDLNLEGVSLVTVAEEKDELRLMSKDSGIGFAMQAAVCMMPVGFVGFRAPMMRRGFPEEEQVPGRKPAAAIPEAAPLPADTLARKFKELVGGLKSDEVTAREDALSGLKALGRQVIPLVAEAARKETDAEVKGRLVGILTEWRAFDAFPELLKSKVDGFVAEFQKKIERAGQDFWGGVVQWRQQDQEVPFPYGVEPSYINLELVRALESADILESPSGLRAVAQRMAEGKLATETLRNLAGYFAFSDSPGIGEILLAARQGLNDPQARCFLQIALGSQDAPKARELVLAGLKDPDVWLRRSSFLAAERSEDPALVGRLIELLKDPDLETRWNASFTLRALTRNEASVNIYVPEDELKASIAGVEQWWKQNQGTFKIRR